MKSKITKTVVEPVDEVEDRITEAEQEILIAEFNYAAQSAFQANEDRVRVFGFVVANIATIISALFAQVTIISISENLFKVILIVLSIIGALLIMQIARLRSAWIESVRTMNSIKEFFIVNSYNKDFAKVFRWNNQTVPSATKVASISFLVTLIIAFIDTISFGYGILLFLDGVELNLSFLLTLVASLSFFMIQLYAWAKIAKR